MNIFDDIIDDSIIKGISKLTTYWKEGENNMQYSFHIYLNHHEAVFFSDVFDLMNEENKKEKEAWLHRYAQVKESIARHLHQPTAAHISNVNDIAYSINEELNAILKVLQLTCDQEAPVNNRIERVFTDIRKLKELALK